MNRRWSRGSRTAIVSTAVGLLVAGCYQTASDDDAAPVVSSIPTAAYSATGADYPPPGAGAAGTTGIAECDAYIRKVQGCTNVPPSTRSALLDASKAMREQAIQAGTPEKKAAMKEACRAATEALSVCDTNL